MLTHRGSPCSGAVATFFFSFLPRFSSLLTTFCGTPLTLGARLFPNYCGSVDVRRNRLNADSPAPLAAGQTKCLPNVSGWTPRSFLGPGVVLPLNCGVVCHRSASSPASGTPCFRCDAALAQFDFDLVALPVVAEWDHAVVLSDAVECDSFDLAAWL